MKTIIPFVLAGVCFTGAFSTAAWADGKAEAEAACEAKCQTDAATAFKQCKDVDECKSYVELQFNSCMKDCDK